MHDAFGLRVAANGKACWRKIFGGWPKRLEQGHGVDLIGSEPWQMELASSKMMSPFVRRKKGAFSARQLNLGRHSGARTGSQAHYEPKFRSVVGWRLWWQA